MNIQDYDYQIDIIIKKLFIENVDLNQLISNLFIFMNDFNQFIKNLLFLQFDTGIMNITMHIFEIFIKYISIINAIIELSEKSNIYKNLVIYQQLSDKELDFLNNYTKYSNILSIKEHDTLNKLQLKSKVFCEFSNVEVLKLINIMNKSLYNKFTNSNN